MGRIEVCGKCGVPLLVSGELRWGDNGVIYSRSSSRNRWVFYEPEIIDPLFRGVEKLSGIEVEHYAIESRRRETRSFLEKIYSLEKGQPLLEGLDLEGTGLALTPEEREKMCAVVTGHYEAMQDMVKIYGYGNPLPNVSLEACDDYAWRSTAVSHPYSIIFMAAEILAGCEAFEGRDLQVEYRKVGTDLYEIEAYEGGRHPESKDKMRTRRFDFKPGRLEFDSCPECGVPLEISIYRWDLEKGIIVNPETGRRMAIFGPTSLDTAIEDMVAELGVDLQETVVEAQYLQIKEAWGWERWNRDAGDFQRLLGLSGMGNLVSMEGDRNRVTILMNNSCLHLLMVGTLKALTELAYRRESTGCTWEYRDDGDLSVTVTL